MSRSHRGSQLGDYRPSSEHRRHYHDSRPRVNHRTTPYRQRSPRQVRHQYVSDSRRQDSRQDVSDSRRNDSRHRQDVSHSRRHDDSRQDLSDSHRHDSLQDVSASVCKTHTLLPQIIPTEIPDPMPISVFDLLNNLSSIDFDGFSQCKGCNPPEILPEKYPGYYDEPCTCTYCPKCSLLDDGGEYDPVFPLYRGTPCTCTDIDNE